MGDTEFIPRHYDSLFPQKSLKPTSLCTAVLASVLTGKQGSAPALDPTSPFTSLTGARFNHSLYQTVKLVHDGGHFLVTIGDQAYRVGGKLVPSPETNSTELVCDVDGTITRQRVRITKEGITLYTRDGSVEFSKPLPKYQLQGGSTGGAGDALAPMPGVIEKVMVEEGAAVAAGDPLMVMIAMKMEYVIKAPAAGTVTRVAGKVGDFVEKNKVLVAFQAEEE